MLPVARTVSRTSHRRGSHLVRSPSYSGSKQEQSRTTRLLGPVNNFSAAESRIRNPIPGRDDDDEEEQEGQLPPDNISTALQTVQTSCGNVAKLTSSMKGPQARSANTALSVLQTSAMVANRLYKSRGRHSSTSSAPITEVVDEPCYDQGFETSEDPSFDAGSGFDASAAPQTQGYFTPRQAWDQYRSPFSTPSPLIDRYSRAGQPVEMEPRQEQFGRPDLSRQSTIASMTNWPSEQPTPETPSPTRSRGNTTRGVLGYENKYHMSTSEVFSLGWGSVPATAEDEPTEVAEEGEEGSVYSGADGYTDGSMAFDARDEQEYFAQT